MTIQEIHNFLDFVLDKEKLGMATPADKDMALDRASMETFDAMLPYYAVNQKFQDALSPFKTSYTFTNGTAPTGIVTFPDNYQRLLNIMLLQFNNETEVNEFQEVDATNSDEIPGRLKSQLRPIDKFPTYHIVGKGKIQIFPAKAATGQGWYLRRPAKPKFAFTQAGRTVTYDSSTSVQLEWQDTEMNQVLYRALQLLGVNLSNDQMIAYTRTKLQEA